MPHAYDEGSVTVVLGLDLSLRSTGMCIIPEGWGGDWHALPWALAGYELRNDASERDKALRNHRIALDVEVFAKRHRVSHVWVEQYAFTAQHTRAHALGELGGLVKRNLAIMNKLPLEVVSPASARTLLGKAPKKCAKDWALASVRLASGGILNEWPEDAVDAFVVANWGISHLVPGDAIVLEEERKSG